MIILKENGEAYDLLASNKFRTQLEDLREDCSWATAFQSWEFLSTWYRCYREEFDPVILFQLDRSENLTGFLPLAKPTTCADSIQLRIAGTHHAEYQCWLAREGASSSFIADALVLIGQRYTAKRLVFKYVPSDAPLNDLTLPGPMRLEKRTHPRPLVDLTQIDAINASLRKKGSKSKLNRLKRIGTLELLPLASPDDLSDKIDQILEQYALRQGAMNGVLPFQEDPKKKSFHLDLMRFPNIMHVSVLSLDGKVAACNIGLRYSRCVSVGVYSYSPFLAHHSPGKLLMLLLAADLSKKGYRWLDLTPGGEWKNRFATDFDQVTELTVFFSKWDARLAWLKDGVASLARRCLRGFGIEPSQARATVTKLQRISLGKIIRRLKLMLSEYKEYRTYYLLNDAANLKKPEIKFARDRLSDLLLFKPSESWHNNREFLHSCLLRLEQGEHIYTYIENGRLLHYGWLVDDQKKAFFSEVQQFYSYPEGTAVLYDFYTVPQARGRRLYQEAILNMLLDIGRSAKARQVAISVLADNGPSRHVIEKIGFQYESSTFMRRRLGRTSTWARESAPAEMSLNA